MEMRREPIWWPEIIHQVLCRNATKPPRSSISFEKVFLPEKSFEVSLPLDALRPVMTDPNINLSANLQHFPDVDFSDMVDTFHIILIIRQSFKMRLSVIEPFPDARETCYAKGTQANDICRAEVVDVWSYPSPVIKLEQVIARFMITSHKDREIRGFSFAAVIFMKVSYSSILDRN